MRTITIAFDTLQDDSNYLNESIRIAKLFKPEEILLLDVIDTEEIELILAEQQDFVKKSKIEREEKLEKLLSNLNEQHNEKIISKVIIGNPKKEIVKMAIKNDSILVINGNHHYSSLEYVLKYGSVSSYLTRHLPCSLMIINTKCDI